MTDHPGGDFSLVVLQKLYGVDNTERGTIIVSHLCFFGTRLIKVQENCRLTL